MKSEARITAEDIYTVLFLFTCYFAVYLFFGTRMVAGDLLGASANPILLYLFLAPLIIAWIIIAWIICHNLIEM
jgi:hypothetical protein